MDFVSYIPLRMSLVNLHILKGVSVLENDWPY